MGKCFIIKKEKKMKKALVVVDMLNDFVKEGGALYFPESQDIIPHIKKKIEEYRLNRLPIIWLCDRHSSNDKEFDRFPAHCISGSEGAQIIDELKPLRHDDETVIYKKRYSGWYDTSLSDHIADGKIRAIEVVGVCTSICVMDTVGGAANRDMDITVPKNCVADFDAEMHEMALTRMENLYGAKIV
jgi:nicotinamidase/pyrazinamidase